MIEKIDETTHKKLTDVSLRLTKTSQKELPFLHDKLCV